VGVGMCVCAFVCVERAVSMQITLPSS